MITVVGLGREKGDLTKNGLKAIKNADIIFVRTLLSKAGKQLKKFDCVSMDDIYESAEDFDALNEQISERILSADNGQNVVYCVDGDGVSDSSVEYLYALGVEISSVAGVSDGVAPIPTCNMSLYTAYDFVKINVDIDSSVAVLVRGISDVFLSGEVKLRLLEFYGGDENIFFFQSGEWKQILLADMDREKKYKYDTAIFIPAQIDFEKERYNFSDLTRIIQRLTRADGCEWDKVQTHESIAQNAIEESYELADAIANDDIENICEEAGDIILQGVFHGDIAKRYGEFTTGDIIDMLCKKLITRHTHIFGQDTATNDKEALGFWEKAKEKEKEISSLGQKLEKIPFTYPSVLRLQKAIKKIVGAGYKFIEEEVTKELVNFASKGDAIGSIVCGVILANINGIDTECELLRTANDIIDNATNVKEIASLTLGELIGGK